MRVVYSAFTLFTKGTFGGIWDDVLNLLTFWVEVWRPWVHMSQWTTDSLDCLFWEEPSNWTGFKINPLRIDLRLLTLPSPRGHLLAFLKQKSPFLPRRPQLYIGRPGWRQSCHCFRSIRVHPSAKNLIKQWDAGRLIFACSVWPKW